MKLISNQTNYNGRMEGKHEQQQQKRDEVGPLSRINSD